jgi:4-hydroxybutyrate dehydrogenase
MAGIAFLKAGCATVHGMSFPLGGTYHVPHGESNYALFGKILEIYDEKNPNGEIMRFKELVARITGCKVEDAIPYLNEMLEKVLPLKPLHEYGFQEKDIEEFADSVEANQQRLITNSYVRGTKSCPCAYTESASNLKLTRIPEGAGSKAPGRERFK